jgi:tetraacyldisaccharide 4'-kinase
MQKWLESIWYQKNLTLVGYLFLPISFVYKLLTQIRRLFYRSNILHSKQFKVPIIVVGNITVGGTGKTPIVIFLAKLLQSRGYRPCIISRGYHGHYQGIKRVNVEDSPYLVGDEPLLMAIKTGLPVWIGKNRVATIENLLASEKQCDVIISDDGLQHYAMSRDIEIVVVDGQRGFGNKQLLPSGPLRESVKRLAHVFAIVVNGKANTSIITGKSVDSFKLVGKKFYRLNDPTQSLDFSEILGKRIHAIAGIGNPARFFNQLKLMGLDFTAHSFPDHHDFKPADLQIKDAEVILMTEKDAVKCQSFHLDNAWVFPVVVDMPKRFEERILNELKKYHGHKIT